MNPIVDGIESGNNQKILDFVNSGLIQIDEEGTVLLWNSWVVRHSGIAAEIALGHPLETLFDDALPSTFKLALQNAQAYKLPVILSNALHHAPLPLYPLPLTQQKQERIQQSITITPIVTGNGLSRLIQIVDASIWIKRESVLKLHSEQQKRVSQQLQESGDRLRILFEQAAVGVAEIDTLTGRFLRVNRKYGEILGYSVEEMLALNFMSVTHPDDLAPDLAQMEHLKQGDIHEFTLEKRLLHGDGSIIWVDLTVSPLWARGGTPTRHIAVVKDITERKQMETELAQGAGWRKAILEHAAQAIIATTSNGLIQTFNPAAEQMLGYRAEDMVGKTTPAIFHDPEEVVERAKIFSQELGVQIEPGFEVFVAKSRRGLPNEYEWTYIRKDGTRLTVLLSVSALRNASGSITGFLGLAVNISERKRAEEILYQSEERFRLLVAGVKDYAIIMLDQQGLVVTWNVGAQRLKGYVAEEIIGQSAECFYTSEDIAASKPAQLLALAAAEGSCEDEGWRVRQDGTRFYADMVLTAVRNTTGELIGFAKVTRDITERKRGELELLHAKENAEDLSTELKAYIAAIGQLALVSITDRSGYILQANTKFCEVSGYSETELIGQNHRILNSGRHPEDFFVDMWETISRGDTWHHEICNRSKSGQLYWVDSTIVPLKNNDGKITGYLSVRVDITDRKQAEQRILEMATHDALTGLPNRRLLQDRIAQALAHARRDQNKIAILFIDLDHFKIINDTLGHDMGDLLLKEVAEKLISSVRSEDTVARQGGDEFIVLLTTITGFQDAEVVAQKILDALIQPFQIGDNELHIGGSIGIALFPSDGEDVDTLLKNSDAAMYHAKQNGRNNYRFFAQLRDLVDEK